MAVTVAVAAVLALVPGSAVAAIAMGGAPTPAGAPPAPPSATGTPSPSAPSAGVLSLVAAKASPRVSFYYGVHSPSLRFEIESTQPQNDLRIDVIDTDTGEVVRSFYRNDVEPNVEVRIRWDGTTSEGRPARNGRYSFRIEPQGGTELAARASSSQSLSLGFALYGYAFPILGAHEFGMGAGRFGAARAGHTHEGQDTMAACGTPLVAARGGTVQYAGYQGAAGNYLVIDGKGTGFDFMYAHLAEPSLLKTGETVRTGQPIGIVGDTGDAVGCHLHFEIWTAPGWYEGGSPIDPLPYLEKWDRYS